VRICKGGTIYGVELVDVADGDASKIRVRVSTIETITYQLETGGDQLVDVHVRDDNVNTNYADAATCPELGRKSGTNRDAYFKATDLLTDIPDSSDIISATFSLWSYNDRDTKDFYVYRCTEDWTEGTITWATRAGFTTDNGAVLNFIGVDQYLTSAVTNLIKDMIDSGNNYGFKVRQQSRATTGSIDVYLAETTGTVVTPKLVVNYYSRETKALKLQ